MNSSMEKPYVVGIDIGGTNTVFGIVDARGTIIATDSIKTIALEAKDRTKAGFLAPARGLFLDEVYYKEKSWKEE